MRRFGALSLRQVMAYIKLPKDKRDEWLEGGASLDEYKKLMPPRVEEDDAEPQPAPSNDDEHSEAAAEDTAEFNNEDGAVSNNVYDDQLGAPAAVPAADGEQTAHVPITDADQSTAPLLMDLRRRSL